MDKPKVTVTSLSVGTKYILLWDTKNINKRKATCKRELQASDAVRLVVIYLLKDSLEFQEHRLYGDDVLEHVLIGSAIYPET